jgi:hypothetical protein
MKKLFAFIFLVVMFLTVASFGSASTLEENWTFEAVDYMATEDVMRGYGVLHKNEEFTRSEWSMRNSKLHPTPKEFYGFTAQTFYDSISNESHYNVSVYVFNYYNKKSSKFGQIIIVCYPNSTEIIANHTKTWAE